MTELSEQVTCPARVGADFHGDPTTLEGRELTVERSLCGGQASFFDQFTLLVEGREVGVLVSQVQSYEKHAILVHGSVSPCLAATNVDCAYLVSQ